MVFENFVSKLISFFNYQTVIFLQQLVVSFFVASFGQVFLNLCGEVLIQIFGDFEFLLDYLELILEGLVQTFVLEVLCFETAGAFTAGVELTLGAISGAVEVA